MRKKLKKELRPEKCVPDNDSQIDKKNEKKFA
jgi:hypothetical protein